MSTETPSTTRRAILVTVLVLALAWGIWRVVTNVSAMTEHPDIAAVALVSGAVQAAALYGFAVVLLPRRRLSAGVRWLAFLLGATFSVAAAITVNASGVDLAPVVEELTKLIALAVMLMLVRAQVRGPLDGLVLGFFVGFGFELVEDVMYTYNSGVQDGDPSAAWAQALLRTVVGFGLHNMFTAIVGAGLALALTRGGRAWVAGVGALGIAMFFHFAWDVSGELSLGVVGTYLVQALIYLAVLIVVILIRRTGAAFDIRQTEQPDPLAGEGNLTLRE